ncbi:hypothetical protein HMPREF1544_08535, partial [Mucor circinelloides 1006PhL]
SFDSLSVEVLLLIFHPIDSVKQLFPCRQACKRCKDSAESFMFCKPPLITESNTLLLQTHLLNKPFRAKSIKTLRLHLDSGINTTTQLIHLVL